MNDVAQEGESILDSGGPTIVDRGTFDDVTGDGREVAGLYLYSQLDRLIDLACGVAADFFARPQLYTDIGNHDDGMPERLARLNSRVGYSEYYPSHEQRQRMYTPVFGTGDSSDFGRLRDALLAACATYAEWSQATGIPMLRERVRTTHRPFREYLDGIRGSVVDWSRLRVLPTIADDEAFRVLRDPAVIAVFGLTRVPRETWPYIEDANGDKVVEEMSKQLEPAPERRLTREAFSAMQRVALRGAEALTATIVFHESAADRDDERLAVLITSCYTWYAALQAWLSPSSGFPATGGKA